MNIFDVNLKKKNARSRRQKSVRNLPGNTAIGQGTLQYTRMCRKWGSGIIITPYIYIFLCGRGGDQNQRWLCPYFSRPSRTTIKINQFKICCGATLSRTEILDPQEQKICDTDASYLIMHIYCFKYVSQDSLLLQNNNKS